MYVLHTCSVYKYKKKDKKDVVSKALPCKIQINISRHINTFIKSVEFV